ncbi:hypothetical protein [Mycobacterium tuberculosis]|nr:hypothetical protein [Mycobacterium tuberculosis]
MTDVHIGWVFTRTVRNNARTHILAGLKALNRPGESGDSLI